MQKKVVFDGKFENGKASGGRFVFKNGFEYEGEWREGTIHGDGKFTFDPGNVYTGKFSYNKMSGVFKLPNLDELAILNVKMPEE